MSKRNDDFFVTKKIWSETKDNLLGCYLKPYFEKIKFRKKPICYIDAFAGKGKFDDGKDGSPRIAMKTIKESFEHFTTASKPIINCYFIDVNYAHDLEKNLAEYKNYNFHVINGKFEDNIKHILKINEGSSVFLYIDPYGIKALNVQDLIEYASHFKSIELLINFNSFGFFRDACQVLNVKIKDDDTINHIIAILEEYDKTPVNSKDILTKIIGTNKWADIILKYKENKINAGEAEIQIARLFCNKLKTGYKYVLNMPLRKKDETKTKYRLVHCCNHTDGCILMANNMYKRSIEHREAMSGGQMSCFELTVDDMTIDEKEIKNKLKHEINERFIHLKDILANFFTKNGVLCDEKKLISFLKEFEKNGDIIVEREPACTEKGKPSTFWSEKSGKDKQSVQVRRGKTE